MAVDTSEAISPPYTPNGVTTSFPFVNFTAASASEIAVAQLDEDGVETILSSSLYTVTLTEGGGSVDFLTAPETGSGTIFVLLEPPFTQQTTFQTTEGWLAQTTNEINDRAARRAQALRREVRRAMRVPLGENGVVIPGIEDRKGRYLMFDAVTGAAGLDTPENFAAPASAAAERAKLSAAFAEEFSGQAYASQAAGEAATSEGQFFRVPIGTTPETYTRYQRTEGGSVEAAPLATTVALDSDAEGEGASLVRTTDDFTVQEEINFLNGPVFFAEKNFGVKGDNSTVNTLLLIAALTAVKAAGGGVLKLPRGTILSGSVGNWAAKNVTIAGAGMSSTILKFTHAGIAFDADAFPIPAGQPGSASQPFIDQFNVRDITIEGNATTTSIVRMQGISRFHWSRVNVREAGGANPKGFHLEGAVTGMFESCYCSKNYNTMTNYPRWGLYTDAGSRNGQSIGQTSEITFINCEFNGLPIGVELYKADQTTMINTPAQNCTNTGMFVRGDCRYNTFIGGAYENTSASAFDVQNQGQESTFIGCYSVKEFREQGKRTKISNCRFERLQIDSSAQHPTVEGITFNGWSTGNGGFSNASATLRWRSLWDMDANGGAGGWHYPVVGRVGITVTASPFTWTNLTGLPVKVIMQTGTVSQVRGVRGGADYWLANKTVPGEFHVAPGDGIEVTYSAAPGLSYVPLGGF